jgi:ABC-type multidrug transport system permease subunit
MTGVGIAVVTSAVSGMFMPYSALPPLLQQFARIYPISSANSSAIYALMGEGMAGYNPLTASQTGLTVGLALFLLILGTILYSRRCWRTE